MSGPTLFGEDGEPLFTPERPGVVILGDLLEYIQEMRNLYDDTQDLYEVLNKNLSFIGSGSPKAVYANLAALQAAKPTGDSSIYLTTDNGNWYYWNGSAWTSGGVYQATQIQNNSIDKAKLSFEPATIKKSSNLFTEVNGLSGKWVMFSDGNIYSNADYFVTDFIAIEPDVFYTIKHSEQVAFYTLNKTYLGGYDGGTYTFKTPQNASYIRITTSIVNLDTQQLNKGNNLLSYEKPQEFMKFDVIQMPTELLQTVESIEEDIKKSNQNDLLKNSLSNPFETTKIKLLGDSITHGWGGTGFADNGNPIPSTDILQNPNGFCWANLLKSNLKKYYEKPIIVPYDDKNINVDKENIYESTNINLSTIKFFIGDNLTNGKVRMRFSFEGSSFSLITIKGSDCGIINVRIDGIDHYTDLYSAGYYENVETSFNELNDSVHTVEIIETNSKNTNAIDKQYYIEGIKISKKIDFVNYAISGQTSEHYYNNRDVFVSNDEFIIMQLGTNDRGIINSLKMKEFQKRIIDYALSKNCVVYLMSANAVSDVDDNNKIFKMSEVDQTLNDLAKEKKLMFISNFKAFLKHVDEFNSSIESLLSDGLHPNDEGYKVMYRNIVKNLDLSI